MADSYLLKRMFRNVALISGLIEKRHPGKEKTGRQVTISSDLVYDVLRKHEPDHVLMRATWADASTDCSTLAGLAICWRASRVESSTVGWTAFPPWLFL